MALLTTSWISTSLTRWVAYWKRLNPWLSQLQGQYYAGKCSNFSWKFQGYSYSSEISTLPLDCCDLVLGLQWLSTLGPILWDFLNPRMEFTLNGQKNVLRGITKDGCKVIKGGTLDKLLSKQPQITLLQVRDIITEEQADNLDPCSLLSHITACDNKWSMIRLYRSSYATSQSSLKNLWSLPLPEATFIIKSPWNQELIQLT